MERMIATPFNVTVGSLVCDAQGDFYSVIYTNNKSVRMVKIETQKIKSTTMIMVKKPDNTLQQRKRQCVSFSSQFGAFYRGLYCVVPKSNAIPAVKSPYYLL